MIPQFPEFIDFFSVEPQEYKAALQGYEPYSDFNYVSVFCWNEVGNCFVSSLNGNLILSLKEYIGDRQILTILGKNKLHETCSTLLEYVQEGSRYYHELQMVPEVVAKDLEHNHHFDVTEEHDNHDYVISGKEYMELPGKVFENKRKNINKFKRHYADQIQIDFINLKNDELKDKISTLTTQWAEWGTEGSEMPGDESRAIHKLINYTDYLCEQSQLYSAVLNISGKFVGFCVFEILDGYAITHFGKAELSIQRAYEYMMAETYKHIYINYGVDLINNEQDLGISGLRHSKLAQHPTKFLKKYTVKAR